MAIREGRWDCTQCGTKKIKGREMFCPGCETKRADDTKFYLADGEPEVTDQEQIKRAKKGVDWYCPYCHRGNQNDSSKCSQCGANRNSPAPPSHEVERENIMNPDSGSIPNKIKFGVVSGALFIVFLIAYLAWPSHLEVEATGFYWNRTVNIEAYQTVTEQDWSVPAGGKELSHRQEIRSYLKVLDHYDTGTRRVQTGTEDYNCGTRDLGNGYFEDVTCSRAVYSDEPYSDPVYREDPVYDTKYTYKINKWAPEKSVTAEASTKQPYWPAINLTGNGSNVLGNEREQSRSEKYTVNFISKEKKQRQFAQEFNLNDWETFEYGRVYTAKLQFGNLSEFKLK